MVLPYHFSNASSFRIKVPLELLFFSLSSKPLKWLITPCRALKHDLACVQNHKCCFLHNFAPSQGLNDTLQSATPCLISPCEDDVQFQSSVLLLKYTDCNNFAFSSNYRCLVQRTNFLKQNLCLFLVVFCQKQPIASCQNSCVSNFTKHNKVEGSRQNCS